MWKLDFFYFLTTDAAVAEVSPFPVPIFRLSLTPIEKLRKLDSIQRMLLLMATFRNSSDS